MEEYIVSARKYRPSAFDAVVGQNTLTTTLKNAIANEKLAHAYLFCGPRGVGKTTCARIFAKTINCTTPVDNGEACNSCESCKAFNEGRSLNIHELDAASNNSVEDIRSLIEQVRIPPQVGRYKVFIIDEVHMLSTAAFNAFLKTLEEPPAHVVFILATTEKHKILPTILSRCQIYDFNRMSVQNTVEHLKYVAQREGYEYETEALNVIAQKADGGMRDALSIFDQVVSFTGGHITYQEVINNLNVLDYEYYFKLVDCFLQNQIPQSMLLFNEILGKGFEGSHFITGLASHFRDLLMSKDASTLPLLEVSDSIRQRYQEQAARCNTKFLYRAIKICNDCDLNYRTSKNKRLLVEITLIQTAQLTQEDDGSGSGQCPTYIIKPLFQQHPANQATATEKDAVRNQEPQATVSRVTPTENHSPSVLPTAQRNAPLPENEQRNNIPKIKLERFGPSIRQRPTTETEKTPAGSSHSETGNTSFSLAQHPSTGEPTYNNASKEDYPITEENIRYCWYEFANLLPQEETAMSKRMKNIQPKLKKDETFEIVVDNEQVRIYMQQMAPRIEHHMRTNLHNRHITMNIRVAEANEITRAYSKPEQFQLMSKKNPTLLKLKEEFGLELA